MAIKVSVSDDKKDIQTRIKRGEALKGTLTTSALIQACPDLAVEIKTLIQVSDELQTCDKDVDDRREKLAIATVACAGKTVEYDAQHGVVVKLLEKYATTPEEARGAGFELLERAIYLLAPPLTIEARYDLEARALRVRVVMPPGMDVCHLELSSTPQDAASWKQLRGYGLRRKLPSLPPGTYWLRACSVVADDESDFCDPVMVVVR